MRITVIGAGRLGTAVSLVWQRAGHAVTTTASRTSSELEAACEDAELVTLAIPFEAVEPLSHTLRLTKKP